MTVFLHVALLILCIDTSNSSIYGDVAGSLSQYLTSSLKNIKDAFHDEENPVARFKIKHNDQLPLPTDNHISPHKPLISPHREHSSSPKTIIRIFKTGGEFRGSDKQYPKNNKKIIVKAPKIITSRDSNPDNMKEEPYRLDAVLNSIRRTQNIARRAGGSSQSDTDSSSLELRDWKNEWKELWIKKKLEALNQTVPLGDVVNMVAARPWGVPCGDPGQHDMPWGSCVLSVECEPEYRIYRGDFRCGRTKFVCCAIQLTNYDMYEGFDISFDDADLSTDSDEQRHRGKGSMENRRKKKERERRRRSKARQDRKKKIKRSIKRIIRTMRKILNRQYRNGSTQRKRKTKQLKKFIKDLKKKYRQDRKSVKNIHEIEMVRIDGALMKRLNEIKELNQNFVQNATFRDMIINGTMTRQGARMLVEAYPELITYFIDKTRRAGNEDDQQESKDLEYDVEYGTLYY